MSEEQLKAFLAKVRDDPTLHDKLKSAQTVEHIVEIAKHHGHHFTAEHVKNTPLTQEELEVVNGGTCAGNGAVATAAVAASIAWCGVPPRAVGM